VCGLLICLAVVGADGLHAWLRILVEMESGNATRNAWRMHSLKAFFDLLLPSSTVLAWSLYAVCSAGLLALLVRAWRRRPTDLALPFAFTGLVAVLVDPHLVDYDLSVLVLPALLALPRVPSLRWWMLLLYPLLLQLSLGPSGVQLTTLAMAGCAAWLWPTLLGARAGRRFALPSPWRSRLMSMSSHTQV
jgi:hypothetical protein